MLRLSSLVPFGLVLFSSLSWCSDIPVLFERADAPPMAQEYVANLTLQKSPLNGRSLIDSWLHPRACVNAGYSECTSKSPSPSVNWDEFDSNKTFR
jgi:hypothetical protein